MTYREFYFQLKKENSKYLTNTVIKEILLFESGFNDFVLLLSHFDDSIKDEETLNKCVERIKNGEPYQYVLERAYFVNSFYKVNKNVLIPRQETEQLAIGVYTYAGKFFGNTKINVADICTGSGILGIYLKEKFPNWNVFATDISEKAIEIAVDNAELHNVGVTFLIGNMVEPLIKLNVHCDVLVCNPPYIPSQESIDEQVWKYEPHNALIASPSTKYYEEIFKHIDEIMNENFLLAFEVGEDMQQDLTDLLNKYLPKTTYSFEKDMYGKIRFLYIIKTENTNA